LSEVPDLTCRADALRVRKKPLPVPVRFARGGGICQTREGPVPYRTNDAILTGVKGEQWPVERATFEQRYRPLFDGSMGMDGDYVKDPIDVLAVQMDDAMRIPMRAGGELHGRPGDWLLQYAPGDYGVISDSIFRDTYVIVEE